MKKIFVRLLCVFMVVAMLVGATACGRKRGVDTGELNVNLPTDYAAELTFTVLNQPGETTTANKLVEEFNKIYPNIEIELYTMPDPYLQTVVREGAAQNLPDIVWGSDYDVQTLIDNDLLIPLDDYIAADDGINMDDFVQATMLCGKDGLTEDGQQYLMARDYNKMVCYYNKDIFDDCGVAYPQKGWTWNDFLSTCAQLKEGMSKLSKYAGGFVANCDFRAQTFYTSMFESYGAGVVNSTGAPAFNDATKQVLTEMQNFVKAGYTWEHGSGKDVTFVSNKLAINFAVRPNTSNIAQNGINFDCIEMPAMGTTPKVQSGCSGYGIYKYATDRNAAWAFISFIMSKEGQDAFGTTGNSVPIRTDMQATDGSQVWTQYPSSDINHEAFVSYPERDIFINYYKDIDARIKDDVIAFVVNMIDNVIKQDPITPDAAISLARTNILKALEF